MTRHRLGLGAALGDVQPQRALFPWRAAGAIWVRAASGLFPMKLERVFAETCQSLLEEHCFWLQHKDGDVVSFKMSDFTLSRIEDVRQGVKFVEEGTASPSFINSTLVPFLEKSVPAHLLPHLHRHLGEDHYPVEETLVPELVKMLLIKHYYLLKFYHQSKTLNFGVLPDSLMGKELSAAICYAPTSTSADFDLRHELAVSFIMNQVQLLQRRHVKAGEQPSLPEVRSNEPIEAKKWSHCAKRLPELLQRACDPLFAMHQAFQRVCPLVLRHIQYEPAANTGRKELSQWLATCLGPDTPAELCQTSSLLFGRVLREIRDRHRVGIRTAKLRIRFLPMEAPVLREEVEVAVEDRGVSTPRQLREEAVQESSPKRQRTSPSSPGPINHAADEELQRPAAAVRASHAPGQVDSIQRPRLIEATHGMVSNSEILAVLRDLNYDKYDRPSELDSDTLCSTVDKLRRHGRVSLAFSGLEMLATALWNRDEGPTSATIARFVNCWNESPNDGDEPETRFLWRFVLGCDYNPTEIAELVSRVTCRKCGGYRKHVTARLPHIFVHHLAGQTPAADYPITPTFRGLLLNALRPGPEDLKKLLHQGQQDLLHGLGLELPAECEDFPVVLCRCRCALCGKDCRKTGEPERMTLHRESFPACENCSGHSYNSYWFTKPQQKHQ